MFCQVGSEPRSSEDKISAKVPFWVAGLHQLWTEDGLALHVLIVARHCYPARVHAKHGRNYTHKKTFKLHKTDLLNSDLSQFSLWPKSDTGLYIVCKDCRYIMSSD